MIFLPCLAEKPMFWAFVGSARSSRTGNGVTSQSSPAFKLHAGNSAFVFVAWLYSAETATVTDTAGNTYTALTRAGTAPTNARGQWFYCFNAIGHATNVATVNFTGNVGYVTVEALQFSKTEGAMSPSPAFDDEATGAPGTAYAVTSDAFDIADRGLILAGYSCDQYDSSFSFSDDMVEITGANYMGVAFKITASASGSPSETITATGAGASFSRAIAVAAFI